MLLDGVVIDYAHGRLDADADQLPDWWESQFFAGPTNAIASAESQ